MGSHKVFQFVGSVMFNKPNDYLPNGTQGVLPTKIIQSNPAGNILGSLTTIAQEGGFGGIDTSHRSMTYLSPSMTIVANRFGSHEFRGGADLYPNISNETSTQVAPVEFYYRPPGTTGGQDVLIERDTYRSLDGTSSAVANKAYEHAYDAYFQDRWKPTEKISIKAGVRIENNRIFTQDRQKVLGALLAPGAPTNIADEEFHQWVTMPNFGIAYNAGGWGVFRGTANRGYEWLDLGGGDGTSHAPYVLATDVAARQPPDEPHAQPDDDGRFSARAELRRHCRRQHSQRPHLCERILRQLGASSASEQFVLDDVRAAAIVGLSERRRSECHPRSCHGVARRPSVPAV